ncbi:MAG: 30S ribosome-binding factor RbfA [Dehalococcoidales bacterium]|nr:30S ribosome-binding factor RbfA [Dehalococcoidales bacterium]
MPHRNERVNNLIRREMSEVLQRHVKDPRLTEFIAVTEVCTSPDLRFARVYVSAIGHETDKQKILNVLSSASGFLRKELMKELRLRRIPELTFEWDDSIERGDRISRLIDEVCLPPDH